MQNENEWTWRKVADLIWSMLAGIGALATFVAVCFAFGYWSGK